MMTFSKDGLCDIATKLGTPLMLNSYTSGMCMQSWCRLSYARAMIELQADVKLKDTIVVAMLKLIGEGFYMCTIRVEYEWKPSMCSSCKVFGHALDDTSTTPVVERIDKLDKQNIDRKLTLIDDDGIPLPKFVSMENEHSDSEVEDVVNEHAGFMASTGLKRAMIVDMVLIAC
nr:hypothetical protein [Tanacetum cinerariifolium]